MRILAIILPVLFFCQSLSAATIQRFDSDITVREDGSLAIQEKVTFTLLKTEKISEFSRILPGLTWLEEESRNDDNLSVEHKQIVHFGQAHFNGQPVSHTLIPYPNEKLSFTLSQDKLKDNLHTLAYEYTIEGQVGYHEKREWLNWNVTSNNLSANIDEVIVKVHLPPHINIKKVSASGYAFIAVGATHDRVEPRQIDSNTLEFRNKKKLEGPRFKIGLTFPFQSFKSDYRRSVKHWETEYHKPDMTNAQNNLVLITAFGSFIFLTLLSWLLRPKRKQEKFSLEFFLQNYSPAAIGYSLHGKSHPGVFTAALLSLIKKKILHVKSLPGNHFELELDVNQNSDFEDESSLVSCLFAKNTVTQISSNEYGSSRFDDCSKKHAQIVANIKTEKKKTGGLIIFVVASVIIFFINIVLLHTDVPLTELLVLTMITTIFFAASIAMWINLVILPLFLAKGLIKKISQLFNFMAISFTLPPMICLMFLVKWAGWTPVYITLGIGLMNLFHFILYNLLAGTTISPVKKAAVHLKKSILQNSLQINGEKEYLSFLALSYGLEIQKEFYQKYRGSINKEYCPGRMSKEIWNNGNAAPLYNRLKKLINSERSL